MNVLVAEQYFLWETDSFIDPMDMASIDLLH
jgi:hypothetical protein